VYIIPLFFFLFSNSYSPTTGGGPTNGAGGVSIATALSGGCGGPSSFAFGGSGDYRLPARASADDEFIRELVQLCNFHRKSKLELTTLLAKVFASPLFIYFNIFNKKK
jgi:hypothetical protein